MSKEEIEILKIIGQIVSVLGAAYFAYRLGLRKRKIEEGSELHKCLRLTLSVLMDLWYEFEYMKCLSSSNSVKARLLFKSPVDLIEHLEFDLSKIEEFKRKYDQSVEGLRDGHSVLFFKLNKRLDPLFSDIKDSLYPLLVSKSFREKKKDATFELVKSFLSDLEEDIKIIADALNKRERKEIEKTIEKNRNKFKISDPESIPQHILTMISTFTRDERSIQSRELVEFYENETIAWLLEKLDLFNLGKISEADMIDHFAGIRNSIESETNFDLNEAPLYVQVGALKFYSLAFTPDEVSEYLIDNKDFYRLLLGFMNLIAKPSITTVKMLLEVNNGNLDPNFILDEMRRAYPGINLDDI
ncbi:hypothetical protein [Roseivirga pacifica]|uniref:hypothetical protein n=1 Tax=Roseivirga pacifica TaxID=1267423 RepID=UPI002094AC35|nr:hypothetical protein [Roseivirga pacifica]MCO6360632.1 hypothetical protein [Roseivirga pacifica]MCO6368521.1 hypothetical protein [Roseivirga pacifica]MCO6372663.1 hypothetical protein [Roseivirga pacifica]MCO6376721.1 hypothetical protein [Roseivirga pacifica]MCO6377999.1 hypothetical protein [Roseivirga pacifica]